MLIYSKGQVNEFSYNVIEVLSRGTGVLGIEPTHQSLSPPSLEQAKTLYEKKVKSYVISDVLGECQRKTNRYFFTISWDTTLSEIIEAVEKAEYEHSENNKKFFRIIHNNCPSGLIN